MFSALLSGLGFFILSSVETVLKTFNYFLSKVLQSSNNFRQLPKFIKA